MIYKKIIEYQETDKTIKDIVEEIAPDIIYFNKLHNWVDDNHEDILAEIEYQYEIDADNYESLVEEIEQYLHEHGY